MEKSLVVETISKRWQPGKVEFLCWMSQSNSQNTVPLATNSAHNYTMHAFYFSIFSSIFSTSFFLLFYLHFFLRFSAFSIYFFSFFSIFLFFFYFFKCKITLPRIRYHLPQNLMMFSQNSIFLASPLIIFEQFESQIHIWTPNLHLNPKSVFTSRIYILIPNSPSNPKFTPYSQIHIWVPNLLLSPKFPLESPTRSSFRRVWGHAAGLGEEGGVLGGGAHTHSWSSGRTTVLPWAEASYISV